jgi:hypothetical protein
LFFSPLTSRNSSKIAGLEELNSNAKNVLSPAQIMGAARPEKFPYHRPAGSGLDEIA